MSAPAVAMDAGWMAEPLPQSFADPAAAAGEGRTTPAPEPLTATERRARAAALRALLLARQRRFAAAQDAFAEAARLDPALDLASIPTFWQLERGGHEAALRAYQEVGRMREAAVLAAEVRRTFRPRLVRTQPERAPSLS